ncbi:hypothetical protein HA45_23015 [Pantoea rodasii]|nr:hypothetical protein HA45_23015 [Pantoea rodasii]
MPISALLGIGDNRSSKKFLADTSTGSKLFLMISELASRQAPPTARMIAIKPFAIHFFNGILFLDL